MFKMVFQNYFFIFKISWFNLGAFLSSTDLGPPDNINADGLISFKIFFVILKVQSKYQ